MIIQMVDLVMPVLLLLEKSMAMDRHYIYHLHQLERNGASLLRYPISARFS